MNGIGFYFGDLYPGSSFLSTVQNSVPEGADQAALTVENTKTATPTSKLKSYNILAALVLLVVLMVVFGAIRP